MYIVTGVSRGLGEAVARKLLAGNQPVIGIGRSHSIDHPLFSFVKCDLSNVADIEKMKLSIPEGSVTLINNAGILGNVRRLSEQNSSDLTHVLMVNTVAPIVLTTKIYKQVSDKNDFTLVNISSGAAKRAIPSWAAYCASKSALNMLSETFYLEEKERGFSPKVYAVAPGVIDTDMQAQIRESGEDNFSAVGNFIFMKENNELFSAEEAASRLIRLLNRPYTGELFYDLRTI